MSIHLTTARLSRCAALGVLVFAAAQPFAQPAAPPDQFFDSNGVASDTSSRAVGRRSC